MVAAGLASQPCIPLAAADNIQISSERLSEGISKTDKITVFDRKIGLGMPRPDAPIWNSFASFGEDFHNPIAAETFCSTAGFCVDTGPNHGSYDWYKIEFNDEQRSEKGKYKTEILLIQIIDDPPRFSPSSP